MSSATGEGPFLPHPAKRAEIDRLASEIEAAGARCALVGQDAVWHGRRAMVESDGFDTDIRQAIAPTATTGELLSGAAATVRGALRAWSSEVGVYDDTMRTLNELWASAKADSFGVDDPVVPHDASGADAARLRTEHGGQVDEARGQVMAVLVRAQRRALQRLDYSADGIAASLRGSEPGRTPSLTGGGGATLATYASSDGYNPYGGGGDVVKDAAEDMERRGVDPWEGFGDFMKFLLMDPEDCVGDEASAGACAVGVASVFPWGKWLKVFKLGKLGKHADDVPAPPPKPKPEPPKPKPEPPPVNGNKQGKHIPGHKNFDPNKSVLKADPEKLRERAGTGTPVNKVPKGEPGYKERIDYGDVIGKYVDPRTGEAVETTKAIIHYAKDGIHIVPARP